MLTIRLKGAIPLYNIIYFFAQHRQQFMDYCTHGTFDICPIKYMSDYRVP